MKSNHVDKVSDTAHHSPAQTTLPFQPKGLRGKNVSLAKKELTWVDRLNGSPTLNLFTVHC